MSPITSTSARLLRTSLARPTRSLPSHSLRFLSSTPSRSSDPNEDRTERIPKKDNFSQGNAADQKNLHQKDPHSTVANQGYEAKKDPKAGGGLDAATSEKSGQTKPKHGGGGGNPEGVGMVDQVGSAGGSARHFEKEEGKQ
ncbi:hypothetical protein CPC08DRAFT_711500 [Agrocybe pediades]|nr:hypothetical protein CPC08DRAFT_711500 [Agrocybe pediades]